MARGPGAGRGTRRSRGRALAGVVVLLSVVSLLIWARLRLVTGLPRTAYAEPGATGPSSPAR